jgi:hypothetical protein
MSRLEMVLPNVILIWCIISQHVLLDQLVALVVPYAYIQCVWCTVLQRSRKKSTETECGIRQKGDLRKLTIGPPKTSYRLHYSKDYTALATFLFCVDLVVLHLLTEKILSV